MFWHENRTDDPAGIMNEGTEQRAALLREHPRARPAPPHRPAASTASCRRPSRCGSRASRHATSRRRAGRMHARVGGSGPPLLLLHGYPETHLMWHAVAPAAGRALHGRRRRPARLRRFVPPAGREDHARARQAGARGRPGGRDGRARPRRFAVAGHDRGGRVAYRMALDHPDAVTRLAVLDIVPTGEIWARADATFALGYWHWAFLAQPAPLPERLILGDPGRLLDRRRADRHQDRRRRATRTRSSPPTARRSTTPATSTAMCEDYRAGATIDRELDDADRGPRTIACPVRALWGADGRAAALLRRPAGALARVRARDRPAAPSSAPRTSSSRTRRTRSPPTSPPSCPRTRSPFLRARSQGRLEP